MNPIHPSSSKKTGHCRYFLCQGKSAGQCADCQGKIVSGSLIYHIAMTLVKAVVGVITGSKVLVAEAVHSFSDCFAFGVNYYGTLNRRVSVLTQSVLIGAIMFVSGMWICADSLAIIVSRIPARPGLFALLVAGISIVVNGHLYRVSACTHRLDPKNSNVFMFMVQNKTNLFAACFGFGGILFAVLGFVYFDPVGAIFIGCFQIHGALQIFKECFEKVRAKSAGETKKRIALSLGVLSLGIIVLFTASVMTTLARRNMILIPSEGATIDSPVSNLLGRAPFFCIIDQKKGTVTMHQNKSRFYNVEEDRIVGSTVQNHGVGVVVAGKVGPKMFTALRDKGVRIYYFDAVKSVSAVVSDYQAGRLEFAAAANSTTGFGRTQVRWLGPW